MKLWGFRHSIGAGRRFSEVASYLAGSSIEQESIQKMKCIYVAALTTLAFPVVLDAANMKARLEDCPRLPAAEQEACLAAYLDGLDEAQAYGCALAKSFPLKPTKEQQDADIANNMQPCRDKLRQEQADARPARMIEARRKLDDLTRERDRNREKGQQLRACASAVGTELAPSSATLTEIGEIAIGRCQSLVNDAIRTIPLTDNLENRQPIENMVRQQAMDSAVTLRMKKDPL